MLALLKKPRALPEYQGRPGMDYWTLFVLATLRLVIDCDYDRLHNLANHHRQLRQLLGHDEWHSLTGSATNGYNKIFVAQLWGQIIRIFKKR